jgi:1-phosphofructokinase/tagatose 6-phosphate kinase
MKTASFLSVCMNPTLQKTLVFPAIVPDRVNRVREHRLDASGKGINVCRVLSQLGRDCIHLTQLGGILRPLFLELCARDNLKVEWVESGSAIRFCYTLLNAGTHEVTELVEEGDKVEAGTEGRLLEKFSALIPSVSALIVSGSKAAGFSGGIVPEMVWQAKAAGKTVILDTRGADLLESLRWKPDIIKPNLYEFASTYAPEFIARNEIAGDPAEIKKKIGALCRDLYGQYGCRIVLTRGASSVWYAGAGTLEEFAVEPVDPVNTTGSGDAFTAGLAAALEEGASLGEAVALGARCGALNAGILKPGVIRPLQ